MKATFLDFRRRPGAIIRALERGEHVTLTYRGKVVGVIKPAPNNHAGIADIRTHPAFGMWADRTDMKNPRAWLRKKRESRKAYLRQLWNEPLPRQRKRAV